MFLSLAAPQLLSSKWYVGIFFTPFDHMRVNLNKGKHKNKEKSDDDIGLLRAQSGPHTFRIAQRLYSILRAAFDLLWTVIRTIDVKYVFTFIASFLFILKMRFGFFIFRTKMV